MTGIEFTLNGQPLHLLTVSYSPVIDQVIFDLSPTPGLAHPCHDEPHHHGPPHEHGPPFAGPGFTCDCPDLAGILTAAATTDA